MEIHVANQRILLLQDVISSEDANAKAWERKTNAFDALSKVTSFLSRPKDNDFELLYTEHRYQPFWHVIARAHYVYDRNANYQIATSNPYVTSITLNQQSYESTNNHIHVDVLEHCRRDEEDVVLVDGITGKSESTLTHYLSYQPKDATGNVEKLIPTGAILVPPQSRVSGLMREALSKMIKGIDADKILEERVEVTCVDLYYRPVYAYQFAWKSKNKEGIVEIDGLTGHVSSGNRTFKEYLGKMLDRDFLFDLGADAAGMLIPGGGIAVKVAKRYMEKK